MHAQFKAPGCYRKSRYLIQGFYENCHPFKLEGQIFKIIDILSIPYNEPNQRYTFILLTDECPQIHYIKIVFFSKPIAFLFGMGEVQNTIELIQPSVGILQKNSQLRYLILITNLDGIIYYSLLIIAKASNLSD